MKLFFKLRLIVFVIPKIGFSSFFYMIYYTFSLKFGFRKKRFSYAEYFNLEMPFFSTISSDSKIVVGVNQREIIIKKANDLIADTFIYYSSQLFEIPSDKKWFYDPYSKKELKIASKHWCDINEFDLNTGDIKNLWEISRFDWVLTLTKAYRLTGNDDYLAYLNNLLKDWCVANPYNIGINWKCGQEASIRVMKLYNASLILNGLYTVNDSLFDFVFKHLGRINGNIKYAIAQSNNHGTSEAAALYIGALWLLKQEESTLLTAYNKKQLLRYKERGRKILEDRIHVLVLKDGTFAQKSVNYHRVVVDTMSFVLYGMKEFKEVGFSKSVVEKLDKLGSWLHDLISNQKGNVPNLGSNDGALFEQLHEFDYRDFRPSVQLFYGLLHNQLLWNSDDVLAPLLWRNIDITKLESKEVLPSKNRVKDNEFVLLNFKDIKTLIVGKQDNFRPSNDILHLDVFYKGINVLIDTGSYSYNAKETSYFKSIKAHNTIQFGNGEPMPKISRFLNGEWVRVSSEDIFENDNSISWSGKYQDYKHNVHTRKIFINKLNLEMTVVDTFKSAIQGQEVTLNFHLINNYDNYIDISCTDQHGKVIEMIKTKGEHSLYYMSKDEHIMGSFVSTVAEGTFITTLKFK